MERWGSRGERHPRGRASTIPCTVADAVLRAGRGSQCEPPSHSTAAPSSRHACSGCSGKVVFRNRPVGSGRTLRETGKRRPGARWWESSRGGGAFGFPPRFFARARRSPVAQAQRLVGSPRRRSRVLGARALRAPRDNVGSGDWLSAPRRRPRRRASSATGGCRAGRTEPGRDREERGRSLAGRDDQRRSDRPDPCPVLGDRQRVGKAARSSQHELMGLEPDVAHADADRSGRHHAVRRDDAPFGDERRQRARIPRARTAPPPRPRPRPERPSATRRPIRSTLGASAISAPETATCWSRVRPNWPRRASEPVSTHRKASWRTGGERGPRSDQSYHPVWVKPLRRRDRKPCGMADQPAPSAGVSAPRVVVLGGGFAGLGAARKLEKADVDVVLVDANDYHSFQPMLYQLATGLLDTTAVAHSLRDLFQHQENARVHQAHVSAIDLDAREVQFADMAPLQYDYLVLGLGAIVQFFGCKGAPEHAFPLYTIEDALRLRSHVVGRWEAADRDPSLVDDGALNIVVVGGGPTGIESVGRSDRALPTALREGLPRGTRRWRRTADPRRGRARALPDVQARHPRVRAARARGARRRDHARRACRVRRADARDARVRHGAAGAHARLGRGPAGEPAHRVARASSSSGAIAIPVDPELRLPDHPEVFAVGDAAWITDASTGEVLPQLGSVALQAGEHAGREHRADRRRATSRSRSSTRTRERWRRSRAAPPWRSCTAAGR